MSKLTSHRRALVAYVVLLVPALSIFAYVCQLGARMHPSLQAAPSAAARAEDTFGHLLLGLLLVVLTARALGALCERIGQPAVVGEIVAGIALGPSVLGRIAPDAAALLFPLAIRPQLGALANLGVLVFMFLLGVELDTSLLKRKTDAMVTISHASIATPFVLGSLLSLFLYPRLAPSGVAFHTFALFMGVAMSVTAFPVLARILTQTGAHKSQLGVFALSCAAVDDVTAWCLLALVVGSMDANIASALRMALHALAYAALMYLVVRPFVRRVVTRHQLLGGPAHGSTALLLIMAFASAWLTEAIGIHAIFGAFLLGILVPHDSQLAHILEQRLSGLVMIVLLPAFFAFTGLRAQLGLLSDASNWAFCGAIVATACLGKIGGTYGAARYTGLAASESMQLGVLMNTRGLVELVVLNIGLDLGVLSAPLFAMMIVMALVTTFATGPLLALLLRKPSPGALPAAP